MKPILFDFHGFALHSFGLMVALGFIAGTWIAGRRAKSIGLDPAVIQDLVFPWILVGTLVGARVLYVVSYWRRDFADAPWYDALAIWKGGLVFYGGLAGATLAGLFRAIQKSLPIWDVADCIAPGLAIGHAFGRIGCFLNGCCYGTVCDVQWGVRYPSGHETHGALVHPVQFYESFLNVALCGALILLHRKRIFSGAVSAVYLMSYAVVRSGVEVFRGDYAALGAATPAGLKPGQYTSAAVFALGLFLWFALRRRVREVPAK
jgi:phosphatidylglycerol:prolipoprotein diacylglycerol transferase